MATLRDIKRRIKSVESTQKITKAMKLVAAAKLRRAQERIIGARPYAQKMVELLKQGQYQPLPVEKQIVIIFAGTQGMLDELPVDAIREFEPFLYSYIERRVPQLLTDIREKKEISDALRETIAKAITDARTEFAAAKGIKAA